MLRMTSVMLSWFGRFPTAALALASSFFIQPLRADDVISQLQYVSEDFPPYNFRDSSSPDGREIARGIFIDVLEALDKPLGLNFDPANVRFFPWARAYADALNGSRQVLFATARVPSREKRFKWAGPVMPIQIGLIARRDDATPVDPTSAIVGVIRNDIGEELALKSGFSRDHLYRQSNGNSLALMLAAGRIDLWAYNEAAALWYINRNDLNTAHYGMVRELLKTQAYFAFSPDVPDGVVNAFQEGIDALKQTVEKNGRTRMENIIQRYYQ